MAQIERLRVFPIKGLDGIDVETSKVRPGGTLAFDREFGLFDADGNVINGKRTDRIHQLSTGFDPETGALDVETPDGEHKQFLLREDSHQNRAAEWFSAYFEEELTLRRDESLGFVDRREMGPSVISTETLRTVASWFEEMTVEGARRRLRANIEISGVLPFWEDRFVGANAPAFEAGGVRFEGVTPCGRCVVPERDPDTGEPTPEFRERFIRKRQETFPDWADEDAFDHYYTMMLIASVPEQFRERTIQIGDPVSVIE